MRKTPCLPCGAIPPHILTKVAEAAEGETRDHARATLEQMRKLATDRSLRSRPAAAVVASEAVKPRKLRNVYDAKHGRRLPGKLIMNEIKPYSHDIEAQEAFDGAGETFDFFAARFGRNSINGRGMRLDSTVHYAKGFDNAMWNGRQMVYGDGDGVVFNRFTAALDVIAHEHAHGYTQFSAALDYEGQTGALNEHLSDAFGIMVKQHKLGQSAGESNWIIGEGLFTPKISGRGVRSMAAPGTAYDDPLLGRDPQPRHMNGYVETDEDNGGVHINSGIPNHAFYLAAMSIGGKTWETLGKIWFKVLTERLEHDAELPDFARATTEVAGEVYGLGSHEQRSIAGAWEAVGLPVPPVWRTARAVRPAPQQRPVAAESVRRWRQRPRKAS